MKRFVIALAVWGSVTCHGAYKLDNPPDAWKTILEQRVSFNGTASLSDFLRFIFSRSEANRVLKNTFKAEVFVKASFENLTLHEVLRAISTELPLNVLWGYREGFNSPSFIQIETAPIDLMSKKIDFSRYPKRLTILPTFNDKAEQDAAANP
jgi:hypothetical protein